MTSFICTTSSQSGLKQQSWPLKSLQEMFKRLTHKALHIDFWDRWMQMMNLQFTNHRFRDREWERNWLIYLLLQGWVRIPSYRLELSLKTVTISIKFIKVKNFWKLLLKTMRFSAQIIIDCQWRGHNYHLTLWPLKTPIGALSYMVYILL